MNYLEYRAKIKHMGLQSVDDFLDNVDYSEGFIRGYQPSAFAVKYLSFCSLINQSIGLEVEPTPISHFIMLDSIAYGNRAVASLCSRGQGKTTLVPLRMPWYMATFNELPKIPTFNFMLYISDSIDNGVKTLKRGLVDTYEASDFLREMIPDYQGTEQEHMFTNVNGVKSYLNCFGILGGIRGQQRKGARPQLAVLDDIMSDKTGDSAVALERMNDVIYSGLLPALDPKVGKVLFQGTPFNAKDPIYSAIESGAWDVNVFPIAEKFPVAEKDFRGGWVERFSYKNLKEIFDVAEQSGRGSSTQREFMLRLMNEDDKLFNKNEVVFYSRTELIKNLSNYNIVITTDFATSKKKGADPSVIVVWAVDWDGNYYMLDGIRKNQTMDLNLDSLFSLVRIYSPYTVGIEVTGQQQGFISWIQREMISRNIHFNLARDPKTKEFGIRPSTDKFSRFNTFSLPLLKQGKIRFPEELQEEAVVAYTIQEITSVTVEGIKSKNDDCLDNVSMLGSLPRALPQKPTARYTTVDTLDYYDDTEDAGVGHYTV